MTISQARTIAFDVLLRVAKQNAYADDVLRGALNESVKTEDAGLATELALGVLRWQMLLDFLIDRYLKRPADVTDAEVRIALRLGFYQLYFLDRVPAHAAVHESVELVKRARKRSAVNLVNAILRKAAKEPRDGVSPPDVISSLLSPKIPLAAQLGIQYSHPTWMIERWIRTYGVERARALLQANNCVPALSGYLLDSARSDDTKRLLQFAGCNIQPGRLLRDAWLLEGGNPSACEAVRKGWIVLQDEASQAVARLVAVDPGQTVLDLCAAPGGKTLLLAHAAGPQGRVIAADLHENRVRAMKERFEQSSVRNVETIVLNGAETLPNSKLFERTFDRILVDVPCSGTGTLARHPEIRWKLRAKDISDLHVRQARLLRNALQHLSPGGRLVYSTCSLEPEENELVVREVLLAVGSDFQIADARIPIETSLQESVALESVVDAEGFFRTFPGEHGTDGFFGAAIERRKPKS
ncbi:MAG TPA: 16S rRNA (cytosine(967)-C(5))-methyltransferase RsmB [Candidatus Acidoferrales bacterium]|nr:16S rRNA (cytosine(967)-C(5))-methyltransferase RsmB [Candidatus Acidoferrales bacterium]